MSELNVVPLTGGLSVTTISASLARLVAEREHYMHRKPMVSHAYGLHLDDRLVGIVTFGAPASRHMQMGACPSNPSRVIELNRLWVHDDMPRNTESWFVSRALRHLPPHIVTSYADTAHGHMGFVYRALNFNYAGWTDMERKTPRYDYIPHDPSVHSRDAFRNGYAMKVRRRPKVRYWTTTGNRTERRELTAMCGWPRLGWKELPPPTEHRQHRLEAA
ncbi:hypothetical protein ACPCIZ_12985 [Streptomyces cellulosae]